MKTTRARTKISDRKRLAQHLTRERRRGRRVVFTSGCFDLLHVGHLRSLEEARSYGDRLVVAINSDASVRRIKGRNRPIIPMRQRAELLAALQCVDWVMSFGGQTPRAVIGALAPDVYAKGGEWPLATLLAQDAPPDWKGEIKRLRRVPGVRTTAILERTLEKRGRSARRPSR